MKKITIYIVLLFTCLTFGQNKIDLKAKVNIEDRTIVVSQFIEYHNNTNVVLDTIYLNDWNNSYSTKTTPLAKRFSEEFNTSFHFAESNERGFTAITQIEDNASNSITFERLKKHPDVIKVALNEPVQPNSSYKIKLNYLLKIPSDKFSSYGVTPFNEYNLKYWYITPAVFDGSWHYYSNKNLEDLYVPKADLNFEIEIPRNYVLTSELNLVNTSQRSDTQIVYLSGSDRVDTKIFLNKIPSFKMVQTDNFTIVSDLKEKDLNGTDKAIITDKITRFITEYLGEYPYQKLIVSDIEANKDPIYGLNQLPDFIRPFPKNFQYELTLLKTTLGNYLNNTLLINPRTEYWLKDAIQIYFLMKYVEENYPDMKLIGALANFWLIRSFHAADLDFNEQYGLTYMHMERTNRNQPLTMARDSLLKFNANLANKYKAGVGLKYLDDFVNSDILETSIKLFLHQNKLKDTDPSEFEVFLKGRTSKDIDWFFHDYVKKTEPIDFKIKDFKETEDSLTVTIVNKRHSNVPISLFSFHKDSLVSKLWLENITSEKQITLPKDSITRLALNYDNVIPEYNRRDNWESLKGLFGNEPAEKVDTLWHTPGTTTKNVNNFSPMVFT